MFQYTYRRDVNFKNSYTLAGKDRPVNYYVEHQIKIKFQLNYGYK